MLSVLVAVVVSQSPFIQRYSSGRATTEDLWAIQQGKAFSKKDLATLEKLASTASREGTCERRDDCSYAISRCMSRFAFILSSVEGRDQSTPKFLEWAAGIVRDGTPHDALPAARRMLAKAKHPSTEAAALTMLRSQKYSCVDQATRMLVELPTLTDDTRVAITEAMRSENGLSIGGFVASRSEPWAQQLALQAIRSADGHLRMGVIRSLRADASDELKDAVNFVANCDPMQRLHDEARERLKKITPVKCPAPKWRVEHGEVTDGTERVKMQTAPTSACIGNYDGRCVGARDFGEFGGTLGFVTRDGGLDEFARDSMLNPRALVKQRNDTLVISSVQHMSGSGGVGVLLRNSDGGVRYEQTMHFTGAPTSWAATDDQLFVEFPASTFTAPCRYEENDTVVMVYERDGGFSLAESNASKCLWKN